MKLPGPLDDGQKQILSQWVYSWTVSVRWWERASIILAVANGGTDQANAAKLGATRHRVTRCRARFEAGGVEALKKDFPHCGRSPKADPAKAEEISDSPRKRRRRARRTEARGAWRPAWGSAIASCRGSGKRRDSNPTGWVRSSFPTTRSTCKRWSRVIGAVSAACSEIPRSSHRSARTSSLAGAGMAPLRAMIRTLLAGRSSGRIHFWCGVRNLKEAPYIEEMEQLARQHPNFSWHLVLSDEAQTDDALLHGLVHEVAHDRLLKAHKALAESVWPTGHAQRRP